MCHIQVRSEGLAQGVNLKNQYEEKVQLKHYINPLQASIYKSIFQGLFKNVIFRFVA